MHTVKLKSGLTFHDGSPVNADAVVYSFNRILDPKTGAIGLDMLSGLNAAGIKKVDDLTVQFTLDKPNVIFYEALAYYNNAIVPGGLRAQGHGGRHRHRPVEGHQVQPRPAGGVRRQRQLLGRGPYCDTLTLVEFADPTAKLNALLGGQVDYMTVSSTPPRPPRSRPRPATRSSRPRPAAGSPSRCASTRSPSTTSTCARPSSIILDRQQMIDQAYGGYGWVGNDMYAPFDPGYPSDLPQRDAGHRAGQVAAQEGRLRQRPHRRARLLHGHRRRRRAGRPGVRAAGQGRRRDHQRQAGRPQRLLRRRLPQVDLRHGLLGHAQLPAADLGRHHPGGRRTTRRTGTTPRGWPSSRKP